MLAARGTAPDAQDRRSVASVLWGVAVLFVLAAFYLVPFVGTASIAESENPEVDQEACASKGSQGDDTKSDVPGLGARAPGGHVTVNHPEATSWVVASPLRSLRVVAGQPLLRTAPKTSPPL